MAEITISRFPGIAPWQEAADPGATTTADLAENVLLARGSLRPTNAHLFIAAGHSGDFVKFNGDWISGFSKPLEWRVGDKQVLFYKSGGYWRKRVGGTVVPLGITRPEAPAVSSAGEWDYQTPPTLVSQAVAGDQAALAYAEYQYFVTISKVVNSREVESKPYGPISAPAYYAPVEVPATQPGAVFDEVSGKYWDTSASAPKYFQISFPNAADDPDAKFWSVYRADDGDEPQLVASLPMTQTVYSDFVLKTARGRRMDYQRDPNGALHRFAYIVTWERVTEGVIDESGPSLPAIVEVYNPGVVVRRPASPPTGVQNWLIYRLSSVYDPTVAFQLVARVPVGTNSYEDSTPNLALGAGLTTSYETAAGDEISFLPPPVVFDGMAGPHCGMFFGWKGSTLYWSEPGVPDAWPAKFTTEAPAAIMACFSQGSQLAVLTSKGVMFGIGSSPETFFVSPGLSGDGCAGAGVADANEFGVFYAGKLGLNLVSGSQVSTLTAKDLGPQYFEDQGIDLSTAILKAYAGSVYIFHASGYYRFDVVTRQHTTHTTVVGAAYLDLAGGQLVIRVGSDLLRLYGGTDPQNMRYRTGEIVLSEPHWKYFDRFEFAGSGKIYAKIEIDGRIGTEFEIDMDATLLRDRILYVANGEYGRAAKLHIRGTGTVKEIRAFVAKVRL